MRARTLAAGAAAVLILVATSVSSGPGLRAAAPRSFRLFALGYMQTLGNAVSYESFRASLETRFEQIAPLLADDRPNVVFLPEDTALTAWLIGPRGALARQEANSAVSAIASLGATYAPQVAYYEARCGVPPARALVLALTDTTWRAFGEPLAELATKYGVYVVANANIAIPSRTEDAALVRLLGDPALGSDYAYEAASCDAYNAAFAFGPDGEVFADDGSLAVGTPGAQVRGVVPKAYLVPIERDQTAGLALSSANPAAVRPIDLGFASFGVFTSKDAWMSDLPNRNDVDGADVFLQPEAGAWAGWSDSGAQAWQQDAMHRAVWGFVQKLPTIRWGALSTLHGNFFDLPFDGTPTITSDASMFRSASRGGANRRHYLLGRRVQDGVVARSEWVVADPGPGIAFADIGARRDFLQAEGAKRAPGSGAPEENDYLADAFVWADIRLPPVARPQPRIGRGPFSSSTAISTSDAPQWEPSLGALGDVVVAAWTDLRTGDEDALVAKLVGDSWSEPVNAGPATRSATDQTDNQYAAVVTVTNDLTVHVVWADFRNQSWEIRAASSGLAALEFSPSVRVDNSESSAEGYPNENLDNDPVVVALGNNVVAAWDDLRGREPDRDVRTAGVSAGGSWQGDGSPIGSDASDQFHPAIASAKGRVWIAWQDHRHGDPDIYAARSNDPTGQSFGRNLHVDDGPLDSSAYHPQIAAGGDRALVAWSDDRSGRYQIRAAVGSAHGFGPSIALAPANADQTYPALVTAGPNRWIAAWTDHRAGDTDIVVAPIRLARGRLVVGRAWRGDDSGPADARLPALTIAEGAVWISWEDRRTGVEQVRVTSAPLRLLFPLGR